LLCIIVRSEGFVVNIKGYPRMTNTYMLAGDYQPQEIIQSIEKGDVHVWQVSLDRPVIAFEKLKGSLSLDEQQRAERFVFEKDRDHFIVARSNLRHILSRYLDISAGELEFAYGEHGKPFLINKKNDLPIQFNLSHSDGIALYAITLNSAIGIDIEVINKKVDYLAIAQRFFTEKEAKAIASLPKHLQKKYFYCYWTLKEAFVKAMGSGLFLSLDQFEVSCLPGELPVLTKVQGSEKTARDWTICLLEIKEGYVAALAVLGKINFLKIYDGVTSFDSLLKR